MMLANFVKTNIGHADVLVHECTFADDISDSDNRGHSCPRIVAKMANLCNASALILNHFR